MTELALYPNVIYMVYLYLRVCSSEEWVALTQLDPTLLQGTHNMVSTQYHRSFFVLYCLHSSENLSL